jgi:hypothetical protein
VLPFGLAEHRPDQPVEQIDSLIGQAGDEIERDGDQGGMTALALEVGHMLHGGAAGFTGELREAGLMNTMAASHIDTDCPDVKQTLDQAQHRERLRCFRHLAQPGEPTLAVLSSVLHQFIQATALVDGQPIGQSTRTSRRAW